MSQFEHSVSEPSVIDNFVDGNALVLILSQHFSKQVFAFFADSLPDRAIKAEFLVDNVVGSCVAISA